MARRPSYPSNVPVDPAREAMPVPPSGNGSTYPQVLDPDYGPQTIHRSDLFFINSTPHMNRRESADSSQLYPYHQQAFRRYTPPSQPVPPPPTTHVHTGSVPFSGNVQRSWSIPITPSPAPPPLPPKPTPFVYPPIGAAIRNEYTNNNPSSSYPTPLSPPLVPLPQDPRPVTSPTDDSDELAMALAISQSESIQRKMFEEKLLDQEEQDLARALAESMLSTGSDIHTSDNPFFIPPDEIASLSRITMDNSGDQQSPTPMPERLRSQRSQEDFVTAIATVNSEMSSPNVEISEFGRYDKWRIPDPPQKPKEEHLSSEIRSEVSEGKRPSFSSPISQPYEMSSQVNPASSRPLSISSASSLPYTLPDPQDGKDSPPGTRINDMQLSLHTIEPEQPSTSPINVDSLQQTESSDTVLVFNDEVYARQLAAEEEEQLRQRLEALGETGRPLQNQESEGHDLQPQYTSQDRQQSGQPTELHSIGRLTLDSWQPIHDSSTPLHSMLPASGPSTIYTNQSYSPSYVPEHDPPPFVDEEPEVRPLASPAHTTFIPFSYPVIYPSLGNRRESESDSRSEASHHSSIHTSTSVPSAHSERPNLHVNMPHQSLPGDNGRRPSLPGPSNVPQVSHVSSSGILNANHFLDRELLLGVSIGFKPPAISTRLLPMQDPMPNIISLPYARCPPLHLQGPDWRHLLRLMARLSGTRIEPTVEAMAISKTDLKLRTVVQFIKPSASSNAWYTVLWFTIDHPVPPAAPGAFRYLSGNPNLLPWSYTLSSVPMLLRDAADTQISKTYTIPATDTVPLPTLPVTFPNLAIYLQAAWDASRRHSSDGSSGLGKLGKMVQTCYPNVEERFPDFDIPERTSVGHLFKRVIGRGNKDKKKGKGNNNEETYQLVTPFVPDEWSG